MRALLDKATLEEYLAQAEDHIDDARRRIERQRTVLAQVDNAHREQAQELLERFEWSLQSMLADRELILKMLASLGHRRLPHEPANSA
jgi:septal ring factor EnvC (AmiA/AmiB activator)